MKNLFLINFKLDIINFRALVLKIIRFNKTFLLKYYKNQHNFIINAMLKKDLYLEDIG